MSKEQLKNMEQDLLEQLEKVRKKMSWLQRRDLRNKAIFIVLGAAVMVWAVFFSGTGV